jgi:putative ABC transport system permease protein
VTQAYGSRVRAARKVTGQAEPHSYYIKTRAGADVKQVAQGLERALVPYGHNVTPLADTFSQGREVARGILQLVQGFMALGLLVGMAALGVISSRTVVERRQQIGMLRAIGYQPATVAVSFLLESSFIALTGITIGTLVGVLLGRQMIGGLLSFATPGQTVPVPWGSIGGVLLLAYLFSLLTTLLPALQASRIYPAEALRYE